MVGNPLSSVGCNCPHPLLVEAQSLHCFVLYLFHSAEFAGSLYNGLAMVLADDDIDFPIPNLPLLENNFRSFVNANHILDLPSLVLVTETYTLGRWQLLL